MHRPKPGQVASALLLELLDLAIPALGDDYTGQTVLDAIRATHAEMALQLHGARWAPRARAKAHEKE